MADGLTRVHYFEQQFLRRQDFADEQAYHLAARRRHNLGAHIWGLLEGLKLIVDEDGLPAVLPGYGFDIYGRELVLAQKTQIPIGAFADKGSDELDVWLVYDLVDSDPAPDGYAGCGDDGERPFYRAREQARVYVDAPDPSFPNPRRPETVPPGDVAFPPHRLPPDDPEQDAPLFLGKVRRDPANAAQPYSVELFDRPQAGLVGATIVAPSGRGRVQIAAERIQDPYAFAVFVPEVEDTPSQRNQPRLALERTGTRRGGLLVRGDTTVEGDVTIAGHALELEAGTAELVGPRPWQLYHVADEDGPSNELDVGAHELRIEMDRHTGDSTGGDGPLPPHRVVIGAWAKRVDTATGAEVERFHPCVTIDENCKVVFHGDVAFEGALSGKAAKAVLTPEAEQFVTASLLSGVGSASPLISRFYQPPFEATPLAARAAPEAEARAVAAAFAADPARADTFAEVLVREQPDLAARLRDSLGGGGKGP